MTPSAESKPATDHPTSRDRTQRTAGGRRGSRATGADWLELSVATDSEAVEAVSEILGRVATGGTSVEPAFELLDEGLAARVDPSRPVVVRAYVPAAPPEVAQHAVSEVDTALGHLRAFDLRPIGEVETRLIRSSDWAGAWRRHFPVLRIGRRIVIRPTWRRHRRSNDDVVVALDPGMAFGTGLHPTTRLCLLALEDLADRRLLDGARVLDVGCGSGILAIAAVRLGAANALGLDVDPIAIEATGANAARNGIARRVRARAGTLPSGAGDHDVVLANLIASLLVELAPALAAELRPGGILVGSGIYVDRRPEVEAAVVAAGLAITAWRADGDWLAFEASRPVAPGRG